MASETVIRFSSGITGILCCSTSCLSIKFSVAPESRNANVEISVFGVMMLILRKALDRAGKILSFDDDKDKDGFRPVEVDSRKVGSKGQMYDEPFISLVGTMVTPLLEVFGLL